VQNNIVLALEFYKFTKNYVMLTINFHPFQNLETERLLLRRLDESDADEVFALRGNPEIMKFIPRPLAKSREDALEHIAMIEDKIVNNTGINWGITIKGSLKIIGIIGHYKIEPENHRAEIGYMSFPESNGKGYMSEAIKAVLIYGFEEMNLHSVEAIIDPGNIGSERVLQKNGFVKEAHILENGLWEGKYLDTVIYSLLKKNFKK
jgi:ribosomal-protein-alanine N-acetyltransferase